MKTILATLMLLACSTLPPTMQDVLQARVTFKVERIDGGSGCGFPISGTEILTAWHVVEGLPAHCVSVMGLYPTKIEQVGELDAAILTFPEANFQAWPLDNRAVSPAETVYASGHGAGFHWWSRGLGTLDPTRVSLDIAPGDSGGALLDSEGDVLGILVARGYYANHHCYIVPITEVIANLP